MTPEPIRPARPAHFAINVDDHHTTRSFYAAVFGWTYNDWGPPGFAQIDFGDSPPRTMIGAVQSRRYFSEGTRVNGLEVTFAVDDLDAVLAASKANGGRVVMERATIPDVGDLVFIEDPSGNVVGAMQYVPGA